MRRFLLSVHIIMVTLVLLLAACNGRGKTSSVSEGGDTLRLRYARNLCIVRFPDYTLAVLRNPWDTAKTLRTYALVDRRLPLPNLPEGAEAVRVPLERCMVYSSVHCSLLGELGAADAIGGVCDLAYIHLPFIRRAHEAGKLADCRVCASLRCALLGVR